MIDLFLYTREGVLINRRPLESAYVPRVGEVVNVPDSLVDVETRDFVVTAIRYRIENDELFAQVHCRERTDDD